MERRCSDDKSSRWSCGSLHWAAQGASISTRRWATRSTAALDGFAGDAKRSCCRCDWRRSRLFYSSLFHRCAYPPRRIPCAPPGREWPENATYNGGFLDKAIALCESMPKPVIAAIFRHSPGRRIRVSRSPAIFVSLKMETT